jgi:excisionase family DNA binding protein
MAPPKSIGLLTTNEAAEKLDVTRRRVLALISAGRLPTVRVGDIHLIDPKDLERVRVRKVGRPPSKAKSAKRGKRR